MSNTLYIDVKTGDRVHLGRRGENNARTIRFDVSEWHRLYGVGAVSLLNQRACDDAPYPCAVNTVGSIVEWPITDVETSHCSNCGRYELLYVINDIVVKSAVGTTRVDISLDDPADEPPEAMSGYMEQILAAGSDALNSAARAEAAEEATKQLAINAEQVVGQLARDAALAANNASASEQNAKKSEEAAKGSQTAASTSEQNAKKSEEAAKGSQTAASASEQNAKKSEDAAKGSQTAASTSEQNAKKSEEAAKGSQTAAGTSEQNAKKSEEAAKGSQTAASTSEQNAKKSEEAAKLSEEAAKKSAEEANDAVNRTKGVKTVNGQSPDDNGNVEIVAGVQSDWNQHDPEALDYVKNRTHYAIKAFEDMVIDFTNPGEVDIIDASALGIGTAYKISDYPMTTDDLDNCIVTAIRNSGKEYKAEMVPYSETEGAVLYLSDSWDAMVAGIYKSGDVNGMYVPSAGTYIADVMGWLNSVSIVDPGEVKQLDEKFIPNTIARQESIEINEKAIRIATRNALNGVYEDTVSEWLNDRAFYESDILKKAVIPKVETIPREVFAYCTKLKNVQATAATKIVSRAFMNCSALESLHFPNVEEIGYEAFRNAKFKYLTWVGYTPNLKTAGERAFWNCSSLNEWHGEQNLHTLGDEVFRDCTRLYILVLRRTQGVCAVGANALSETCIANGTGFIYVPAALLESYKAAANWSLYASQFRALEDYTYDGTVTGDLDYDKINA